MVVAAAAAREDETSSEQAGAPGIGPNSEARQDELLPWRQRRLGSAPSAPAPGLFLGDVTSTSQLAGGVGGVAGGGAG